MKYKGYTIEPVFLPGSDFKLTKAGCVVPRKPEVEYYEIRDRDGERWGAEFTIPECKAYIDVLAGYDAKLEKLVEV